MRSNPNPNRNGIGNKMNVTPGDLALAFGLAVVIFGLNVANLFLDWQVLIWLYIARILIYLFVGYQTVAIYRRRFGGPANLIRPRLPKVGATAGLTTAGLGWGVFLLLLLISTLVGGGLGINLGTASLGINFLIGLVEIFIALLLGAGGANFYHG